MNFFKKNKNYFLAFIIPIILFLISLMLNKIYPFGNKVLLMLDGYNQYPGFLNTLREFILNHSSIFYSLKGLTGFNLLASSIYYTFNLTNLFYLLFKASQIIDYYTFIIIIKLGLASLSMYIFLNYLKKSKYNLLFSICFALSTYNILYYLNYMWFDSIILLPLVILGIEKIFKDNKGYLYVLFLSLSIISNFYMGYMICIFSLIYFIYKVLMQKEKKKYIIKFIINSLTAGLISTFILLPVILELMKGKGALFANTNYFGFDLDFLNVFYKLTIGSFLNGDLEYGTPNVYISIFIYLNALLFFFNNKIKLKEKIICGSIILFFLLSMSFNLLDYFWQMLQMPIYYPVRYAYIFDFFLIYLGFKNFHNYDKPNKKKLIFIIIFLFTFIIIGFITSGNLLDKINIPAKLIYLGISIMFILYYLIFLNNQNLKKYLIIIIIIELLVNSYITIKNNGNNVTKDEFITDYTNNLAIVNSIKPNNFERISIKDKTIKNNGLLHNYNDLNYFSSLRNKKTIELIKNGFDITVIDDCSTNYYYNNPLANSLLNIKYYVTKDNLDYYELKENINGYNVYLNNDVSGIGFTVNSQIKDLILSDDYINNINNLVKTINNNEKNIIKEIEVYDKNVTCSEIICITEGESSYLNYHYKANKKVFIYLKNDYDLKDTTIYKTTLNGNVIDFDNTYPIQLNKNDVLDIYITPNENSTSKNFIFRNTNYHLYEIDYNIYQELITNIKENPLEITEYQSDHSFKGKINVQDDTLLFTSISNDDGWSIYVDGKETKITPIYDGFIGIELSKGEHIITFKYTPPGLKNGLIISSSTLIIYIGAIIIKKKINKRNI